MCVYFDRYILSVGWDKQINIYNDSTDNSLHNAVQHPHPRWDDDVVCYHYQAIPIETLF